MVRLGLDEEVLSVLENIESVALVMKVTVRLLAEELDSFLKGSHR